MERESYRHELKYFINNYQYDEIKPILSSLLKRDSNMKNNKAYTIRSLYFEDMYNSAYNEKQSGLGVRKKYRIRIYNYSDENIKLECKHKNDSYIFKEHMQINKDEYDKITKNDIRFLLERKEQLAHEFYVDMRTRLLKPKVIVDYERESFVDKAGDVRITFDRNIRAVKSNFNIFNKDLPHYNVLNNETMIVEIKFTGILPEKIRKLFKVKNYVQTSASKYCLCVDKMNGVV